ncbi:unnamed protein product [Dovyalis caffra]|uniref:BZIP domain-containing protein n=1 Tax=Dovyalis caffra TaxID=77055 RepID=A0AAV1S1S5_9ROSI|nr:unnamed protein product [Dovyalis caffra]
MLNPKRNYSSYFQMEVNSRPRAPSLLPSASDSFASVKQPGFVSPSIGNNFTTRGFFELNRSVIKFDETPKHFQNVGSSDNPISGIKVPSIPISSTTIAGQQNVVRRRQRRTNALEVLANRMSAQRSRLRKLAYLEKLKMNVKLGEARVSWLIPLVSLYRQHRLALKDANFRIKETIKVLEKIKEDKRAEFQYLREEIRAMRRGSLRIAW